jgi:hypothetical protein
MDEGKIDVGTVLVAGHQPPEGVQPRSRALDDPAVPIAPELPSVLPAPTSRAQMRHHEVDPAALQPLPERARVVAAIGDKPRRLGPRPARPPARDAHRGERPLGERDLGQRGSRHAHSERYTRALDQYPKSLSQ